MNVIHFNGLAQHPFGITMTIDVPLPHLNATVIRRQYGKTNNTIHHLDDLTLVIVVADIIYFGRRCDQS